MKRWTGLVFLFSGFVHAGSDVCTNVAYKEMCDRAVVEGIKRIQPYVTRPMRLVYNPMVEWRNGRSYVNPSNAFRTVPRYGIPELDQEGINVDTCERGDCISEHAGSIVVPATIKAEANFVVNSSDVSALKSLETSDIELPEIPAGVNPCSLPEYSTICQRSIITGMNVLRQFNLVDGNKGIGVEIGKAVVSTIVAETIHIVVDHVRTVRAEAAKERARVEARRPSPTPREHKEPVRTERGPRYMDPDPEPHPTPAPGWSNP